VNILTKPTIVKAIAAFPKARKSLERWYVLTSKARWRSYEDVKRTFKSADKVGNFYIFDINNNDYRLVVKIAFVIDKPDGSESIGFVYVQSFLTHTQYDDKKNWTKGVIG
jgi:mRNA interferase HigB